MSFGQDLADVLRLLEAAGIPAMVTGSIASSFHGEPRATRDIDVVVDPTAEQLTTLVESLREAGFYADDEAAQDALRERGQFNAVSPDATKVDFIIRKDRLFSRIEFERREPVDLLGAPGAVATAEDVVIAKLEWSAETDSERQLRDAAAVVAVANDLDVDYIDRWTAALGISGLWREIRPTS